MVWFQTNTYTETETRKEKHEKREGKLLRNSTGFNKVSYES